VQLIFTSPPYNIGYKYHTYKDSVSWEEYTDTMQSIIESSEAILYSSGILAINIPFTLRRTINKKLQIHSGYNLYLDLLKTTSLMYRDTIIWAKHGLGTDVPFMSQVSVENNPYMAPACEPIIIASKEQYKLENKEFYFGQRQLKISQNLWLFSPNNNLKYKAAFPLELADAMITLFSEVGDTMCGNGTTLMAAKRARRKSVGVDIDYKACMIAKERISQQVLFPLDDIAQSPVMQKLF
jgi:DNA modification methylase